MKEKYRIADYPAVRDAILQLVLQKKLDAIDVQIIAERDCSPMPTMREVALHLGVGIGTVHRRTERIKALIINILPANF